MTYTEVNFDGIVCPTHNYAGRAFSRSIKRNKEKTISNPKAAALFGLKKMHLLMQLGVPQAVLPPHPRPNVNLLHSLGFSGTISNMLQQAYKESPQILEAIYTASSVWTANAATVSPPMHTPDNVTHIIPANLITSLHRAQEAEFNYKIFKQIFKDENYFIVHEPLISCSNFSDEGAANHTYICTDYANEGLELFVYGRKEFDGHKVETKRYFARQTLEASTTVARINGVKKDNLLFMQQNPEVTDLGALHNDMVFVGNKDVLFYHEKAFLDLEKFKSTIMDKFQSKIDLLEVSNNELSLEEALHTYIFNSQLVSLPTGGMAIIATKECEESKAAKAVLDRFLSEDNEIKEVHYLNCREHIKNGGGPACLRLRVVMDEKAIDTLGGNVLFTEELYGKLTTWVNKHYRDKLAPEDLLDINLHTESLAALKELYEILNLKD